MGQKKVLIIEDHGALRYVMSYDLTNKGFKTLTAGDGEAGIEMAKNEIPDIILLDVMMPKLNGFEVCRRLKAFDTTKNIPVIMVTAAAQKKDILEGYNAGAVSYIIKPYSFEALFEKIVDLIGAP